MFKKVPYDALRDFAPILLFAIVQNTLSAKRSAALPDVPTVTEAGISYTMVGCLQQAIVRTA